MSEKELLRANKSMLTLVDRELARLRDKNGPLAALSQDVDSFLPYMISFVGPDAESGVEMASTALQQTVSGVAQIDGDAAFEATGWQAYQSDIAAGDFDFPLYNNYTLALDTRLVDMTAGRVLTRGEGAPEILWATRFSVARAMCPVVPFVSPFVLPRNTTLRLDLRLTQNLAVNLDTPVRIFFILHGFKVFGD